MKLLTRYETVNCSKYKSLLDVRIMSMEKSFDPFDDNSRPLILTTPYQLVLSNEFEPIISSTAEFKAIKAMMRWMCKYTQTDQLFNLLSYNKFINYLADYHYNAEMQIRCKT